MLFFFLFIVALFGLSIVYFNRMGFLSPVPVKEKRLPKSLLLFTEYVGDYRKIGSVFENLTKTVKPKFKPTNNNCGIFYDDPSTLEDRSKARAACGLLIEEDERQAAEKFVAEHSSFKLAELPELDCVYTRFPFKSRLSMLFIVLKVYPEIRQYAFRNRYVRVPSDIKGIIEIYRCDGNAQIIEVVLPYGQRTEQICLSSQPVPQERSYEIKKEE